MHAHDLWSLRGQFACLSLCNSHESLLWWNMQVSTVLIISYRSISGIHSPKSCKIILHGTKTLTMTSILTLFCGIFSSDFREVLQKNLSDLDQDWMWHTCSISWRVGKCWKPKVKTRKASRRNQARIECLSLSWSLQLYSVLLLHPTVIFLVMNARNLLATMLNISQAGHDHVDYIESFIQCFRPRSPIAFRLLEPA